MEGEKYNFPTEDNPPFPSRFRGVEDEDRPKSIWLKQLVKKK